MAIENVTISDSTTSLGTYGFRLKDGSGTHDLRLHWSTWNGLDWAKNFVFESQFRGVPKGTTGMGESGNTQWSAWTTRTISASSCHPYQRANDDKWWWYIDLASVVNSETALNGGSWSYASRIYDQVQVRFRIKSNYNDGYTDILGNTFSPTAQADVWVGYFPNYTLGEIYQQGSDLIITYTASGWTRKDDRYEILSLKSGSRNILQSGTWGSQSGLVEKLGWISIPLSSCSFIPDKGDSVYAKIRWNASYREIGMDFADASGYLTFTDQSEANTPVGDVTVNGDGSISVGVGDSGDKGNEIYEAIVKIDIDGFEFDQIVINKVDMANAMLNFPPLGKEITVQIQGTTQTGGVSDVIEKTVFVPAEGRILIDAFDDAGERVGEQCVLSTNIDWDVSRKREKDTVKLAGRKAPSAFFGEGKETSITLSGEVFWKDIGVFDADRFYALGDADLVCIRFPDGQRFVTTIDDITTSESASDKITKVKINATEVE